MRTFVRAAAVVAAGLVVVAAGTGVAGAQPVPPPEPTPADQAAQYACVQEELDFAALPQQAIEDPVVFSALVADAAQKCEDVRAPAPAVPAPPVA
ncbi:MULTISPECIES: hypothetical protein [Pseudonocardia]|uniref:Haemophore haem-binding domain-containing protein n=2 Tax=Pseudonocardia TaxID=1847 RepID=A0A1Y2N718_PSEAH|nr:MULTISPECIES: hypothetical protein [Pseudonocardia]OSY43253.1 hypothetical protein BG845_00858 [Pseudonocardia autotrophica]TDN71741.1 hypothetical protein C8E95_0775 [Pseudonocardia autotrophica]BBG02428.1 hypothetical protein Pdca_36370 [Pseudonocardia autotrophica]GEC23236.1 hypothetical protein PSA01_02650 [Pseudonocardia saturnea]